VLAAVVVVLVIAGALASLLPARRATRVNPIVALRCVCSGRGAFRAVSVDECRQVAPDSLPAEASAKAGSSSDLFVRRRSRLRTTGPTFLAIRTHRLKEVGFADDFR
jgi:hypothetical protein